MVSYPGCHIGCIGAHATYSSSDIIVVFNWRHQIMSHISVFRNIWEPLINIKWGYLMVSKKYNPLFVWGLKSASVKSLVMSNSDPRDWFFYPTYTLMMHSNSFVSVIFLWSRGYRCSVLACAAMGWSVVCDCNISLVKLTCRSASEHSAWFGP